MQGSIWVLLAAVTFVGTHFVMSHPLRKMLVGVLGQVGFLAVYSLVSILSLLWLALAYRAAPLTPPLWAVGNGLWAIVTALMLMASVLLMGSLLRNPALPTGGRAIAIPAKAQGVFAITRHPMLWSFALWALCHIAVFPVVSNIILAGSILVLALVGAALQDHKKRELEPDAWREWQTKTSYWPFAAIVTHRAHFSSLGWHTGLGGIVMWIALTWAHIPLYGVAAGIWRWIR